MQFSTYSLMRENNLALIFRHYRLLHDSVLTLEFPQSPTTGLVVWRNLSGPFSFISDTDLAAQIVLGFLCESEVLNHCILRNTYEFGIYGLLLNLVIRFLLYEFNVLDPLSPLNIPSDRDNCAELFD